MWGDVFANASRDETGGWPAAVEDDGGMRGRGGGEEEESDGDEENQNRHGGDGASNGNGGAEMEGTEVWRDENMKPYISVSAGGPSPAQWSVNDTPSGVSSNASSRQSSARRPASMPSTAAGGGVGNASTSSTSRTNERVWRRKYAYDPWTKRPVVMGVTQRRFWCWEVSSSGWWIGFTFLVRARTHVHSLAFTASWWCAWGWRQWHVHGASYHVRIHVRVRTRMH